jgi:hypothetical protein
MFIVSGGPHFPPFFGNSVGAQLRITLINFLVSDGAPFLPFHDGTNVDAHNLSKFDYFTVTVCVPISAINGNITQVEVFFVYKIFYFK